MTISIADVKLAHSSDWWVRLVPSKSLFNYSILKYDRESFVEHIWLEKVDDARNMLSILKI